MADYGKTAADVIKAIGGERNIKSLVHCVTRLRFNLNDKSLCASLDDLASIPGTLGAVWQGEQLQIIIGPAVNEAYDEVCKLAGLDKEEAIDENLDPDLKKRGFSLSSVGDVFIGVFAPMVPAFAGAGIIKGILTLLTNYGLMASDTGTYVLLNAIGDCVFYFLPFLVAFTAARKFKTNEVMALCIAGIYLYPTILENAGQTISVFGFDVTCVKYSSTVLPVLISVWIMSYLYAWISKHCVDFLRVVVVPIVTLLVSGIVGICIVGPIGYNLGIYVGEAFKWLFDVAPWLGGLIDGATRPLVVFTGMHMTLSTVMINNISTLGYDMLGPVHACATMAAAGMCFGAFLRARKADNRSAFFSSFISAFIGITEPALYGIAFRFKRPLIALCIGGGVSGALVAMLGGKAITFAMPSIISLPAYSGTIPQVLIGLAVAFVVTAALTYVLSFDEGIEKDERAARAEEKAIKLGK